MKYRQAVVVMKKKDALLTEIKAAEAAVAEALSNRDAKEKELGAKNDEVDRARITHDARQKSQEDAQAAFLLSCEEWTKATSERAKAEERRAVAASALAAVAGHKLDLETKLASLASLVKEAEARVNRKVDEEEREPPTDDEPNVSPIRISQEKCLKRKGGKR